MSAPRLTEVALFTADDHVAFTLARLDDHTDSLKADGLDIDGPRDMPWGRSAYVRDPDGRLVELT